MAKGSFPSKDNFGATKTDMNRGFSEGMAKKKEEDVGFFEDMPEHMGENQDLKEGFLGRRKGWER
jgi:hypothetical protein